jgi:hypothetical protein
MVNTPNATSEPTDHAAVYSKSLRPIARPHDSPASAER